MKELSQKIRAKAEAMPVMESTLIEWADEIDRAIANAAQEPESDPVGKLVEGCDGWPHKTLVLTDEYWASDAPVGTQVFAAPPSSAVQERTPEEHERIMQQWDYWRKQIANGDTSSAPRDWFGCVLDSTHPFSAVLVEALEKIAQHQCSTHDAAFGMKHIAVVALAKHRSQQGVTAGKNKAKAADKGETK